MKALSIMQPWAWLIVNGLKDIENRRWWTDYRGPVLIHAGKRHDGPKDNWPWANIPGPDHFDYGGIVGQAEIVDCVTTSKSEWFCGPFGFVIRNARPLPFQPCRGHLGLFDPTPRAPRPEADAVLRAQLGRVIDWIDVLADGGGLEDALEIQEDCRAALAAAQEG